MRKFVCVFLFSGLVSVGCSSATRGRLAHWFFDIPGEASDKTAEVIAAAAPGTERPILSPPPLARFVSQHPPYLLRQCDNCHDATQRMTIREDLTDSCGNCHARFFSSEVGHPPVEQGECVECHEMHRSKEPALLKQALFDVCIECHDEPEDLSEPAHAVEGVERCTACHDPHFGTGALLKPEPAIAIPG